MIRTTAAAVLALLSFTTSAHAATVLDAATEAVNPNICERIHTYGRNQL